MVATRSDGMSIVEVLARASIIDQRQNRLAGFYECRDPECPSWAEHVAQHDAFFVHYHPVPPPG